jgi:hypothetical protein
MKIVSIHQPHFLPWLGYFNKIKNSDLFIVLDDVQFRKNYFQNRTQIKNTNSEFFWFSIPINKAPLETKINKITILEKHDLKKNIKQLEGFYQKTPFFKEYFPELKEIFEKKYTHLSVLNYDLLVWALKILSIETPLINSSEILSNAIDDPNERLIELCKQTNTTHYIAGKGGKNYMNENIFEANSIKIIWQEFDSSKIEYPQINGSFLPNLSFIDTLFNIGAEETKQLIETNWKPIV